MRDSDRKQLFRLFAMGMTPEEAAEMLKHAPAATGGIGVSKLEKLLQKYLALPIGEKLRLTLLPEWVSNRTHRLIDDIADLERVDALLASAKEKEVVSLLDIKRRIKERMAKESAAGDEIRPRGVDGEIENEIDRCYEKVFGSPPSEE